MLTSLPNLLTFARIGAVPLLVALFFVEAPQARWAACALFTAAAITDWLDGYFARAWSQQSSLGRMLDPIADKILVGATLLLLAAFRSVEGMSLLAAIVILCREIMVSGLREYLAELRVGMPVSRMAKWKTGIQMTAIGFLVVGDTGPGMIPVRLIGETLLAIAAVLTLATGYDYLRAGLHHATGETPHPVEPPAKNAKTAPGTAR
jgi:cardiolipin synthase